MSEQSEPPRILLVGNMDYAGLSCRDWFSGDVPNAADFSVVVIDGARLSEIIRRERGDKETPFPQVKLWQGWLGHLNERLRKLMKAGGLILAVVDEQATAVGLKPDEPVKGYPVFASSTDWMPVPIALRRESGEAMEVKDKAFRRYMQKVDKWSFFLEIDPRESLQDLSAEHDYDHVEVELEPIAVNLQQLPVAATASYSVHKGSASSWKAEPYTRSGKMHVLPAPTNVSLDEGLRVLLEDVCGLEARQTAPDWASATAMAGAADLDEQIKDKRSAIDAIRSELSPLVAERGRRESFKAILYETGIAPLQDMVENVFREIGLQTKLSNVSDEFVVVCDGQELLVEVKGNKKGAKLTDLRQLIDYQLEHEQTHGAPIKSALIENAWRELPPAERGAPRSVMFEDNVIRRATSNGIALLDTVSLYNALNGYWLGEIDGKAVFSRLVDCSGVVRFPGHQSG